MAVPAAGGVVRTEQARAGGSVVPAVMAATAAAATARLSANPDLDAGSGGGGGRRCWRGTADLAGGRRRSGQ